MPTGNHENNAKHFMRILHNDQSLIAVEKPSGLLVHRSRLAKDSNTVKEIVEESMKIDNRLYSVHRLDRGTSGVLIFAKTQKSAAHLSAQFRENKIKKKYWAIARGYTPWSDKISRPVRDHRNRQIDTADTIYRTLGRREFPHPVGPYSTARYSWVEIMPVTGRYHQIRQHFHSISHPIIGDTVHGDGKHNRFFREHLKIERLCLICKEIEFTHPETEERIRVQSSHKSAHIFKLAHFIE